MPHIKDDDSYIFHMGTKVMDDKLYSCGGRVLSVTSIHSNLDTAIGMAYSNIEKVVFGGIQYRKDIGSFLLKPVNLAIIGSGKGTDMQTIIHAIRSKILNAKICMVISNIKNAGILEKAHINNINNHFIESKGKKIEIWERKVIDIMDDIEEHLDLILLIGFNRILSPLFVERYKNRILNVHPSLLPKFSGGIDLKVHEAIINAKEKVSGCTIHFVNENIDGGSIVIQKKCNVIEGETPASLKDKVQKLEGEAFIEVIRLYQQNRLIDKYNIFEKLTYKHAGVNIDEVNSYNIFDFFFINKKNFRPMNLSLE